MKRIKMAKVKKILHILQALFNANVLQSCVFNYKMLPLREALHFPILIYGKAKLINCTGRIIWKDGKRPQTGAWQIGKINHTIELSRFQPYTTIISIKGNLVLGSWGWFGNGGIIDVDKNGECLLGSGVGVNANCLLRCERRIVIKDYSRISWNCQFTDTDFHYVLRSDHSVHRRESAIYIGERCWIGNHCYFKKGSKLSDYSIVAALSMVSKDYSSFENAVLAGIPAKPITSGNYRIYAPNNEEMLEEFFNTHPDEKFINLTDNQLKVLLEQEKNI